MRIRCGFKNLFILVVLVSMLGGPVTFVRGGDYGDTASDLAPVDDPIVVYLPLVMQPWVN